MMTSLDVDVSGTFQKLLRASAAGRAGCGLDAPFAHAPLPPARLAATARGWWPRCTCIARCAPVLYTIRWVENSLLKLQPRRMSPAGGGTHETPRKNKSPHALYGYNDDCRSQFENRKKK